MIRYRYHKRNRYFSRVPRRSEHIIPSAQQKMNERLKERKDVKEKTPRAAEDGSNAVLHRDLPHYLPLPLATE